MTFNVVTVFSPAERSTLKKAFQEHQRRQTLLTSTKYNRVVAPPPKYVYVPPLDKRSVKVESS